VKRFEFPLARVRDFRQRQLESEEVKLQVLLAERQALASESARLAKEASETRLSLMVTGSAESQDLSAMDSYLRHLAEEKKRHALKVIEWQGRAAKQQQAVVEARRRLRLMEKLEARRYVEWKAALDREQENLSSELYLARWKRE
jgi:flagellar export protein FliJ